MSTPVTIGGRKVGKLRGSWLLFKETWRFLMADTELVLVPFITGLINLLILGLVIAVCALAGVWDGMLGSEETMPLRVIDYALMFAVYVIAAFTLAISQAAIVHTVFTRAHGGNATLGESLGVAFSHWFKLLTWSVITSTVGIILRAIVERSQLLGKVVATMIGGAWNVLTFFVIPSMVLGNKSAIDSITDSATLFKKTWGETLVSNISLGLVFLLAHVLVFVSMIGLIIAGLSAQNVLLMVLPFFILILWLIISSLVLAALQGILKTLLYIYAAEGMVPGNFNRELLEGMMVRNGPQALPVPVPVPPASTITTV